MVIITEVYEPVCDPNPRLPGLQTFTRQLLDPLTRQLKGQIHFIGSTFDQTPDNQYIAIYASIVTEKGIVMYNYLTLTQLQLPLLANTTGYPPDTIVKRDIQENRRYYL